MRKLATATVLAALVLTGCGPDSDEPIDPSTARTISSDRQIGPVATGELLNKISAAMQKAGTFTATSHAELTGTNGVRVTDTTARHDFTNPDEHRMHLVSTSDGETLEVIVIGLTTWTRQNDALWTKTDTVADPTVLFPDGTDGSYVAREKISGRKLHHYRYAASPATIDLYLDNDDLPRLTITTTNGSPLVISYTGYGDPVEINEPDPAQVTQG